MNRYLFLDGLRGIAVLWVIIHHINTFFNIKMLIGVLPPFLDRFAAVGPLGVEMFFVISGFLITGLLLQDLDRGKVRIGRFYARRFFKIVPQYLVYVLAGLYFVNNAASYVMYGKDPQVSFNPHQNILNYFLFIQNYFPRHKVPVLAHTWSLAVEEHFYLLYPFIFFFVCVFIKKARQKRSILAAVLIVLILMAHAFRLYIIRSGGIMHFQMTHFLFDGLIFGGLIKIFEKQISGWSSRRGLPAVFFFGSIFIYYVFIMRGIQYTEFLTLTLAYLAPGFLIISALMGFKPAILITENPVLRWTGKNSYGIYLWHYILIFIFAKNPAHALNIAVYFFTAILAGYLSTITLEKYFLNLRRRIFP